MSNLNPPGSRVVQRLVFELVVVLLGVFLAIRL
jgi:hypothetical protein